MRIQKVNEHMVRIFISFTELADRDITMTDLFQRTSKTEQLFWELIAQAREEVEFNLDQPFWIQATVSSNDEFVITVMKQEEQFDGLVKEKEKKQPARNRIREWVYAFADFEDVLAATALLPQFPQLHSSLYELSGEYFLTLQRMGSGKKRQTAESILDEYGELVNTSKAFLDEHGKVISKEKAVEMLGEFFLKRKVEKTESGQTLTMTESVQKDLLGEKKPQEESKASIKKPRAKKKTIDSLQGNQKVQDNTDLA